MISLPDIYRGCKVFPVQPGGKLPATENGWKDASDDPRQIAEWLRINPDFNWAVACGPSGLFVFDIDPNGLDWWANLLERNPVIREAVKRAFQVRTPRGGLHIYFRGQGPSTASRIADGIDTRGGILKHGEIISGGYVLLPGSKTADGSYSVLPGGAIEALPDFMSALVPERKKTDTLGLLHNPDKDLPRNIKTAKDLLNKYVVDGRISKQGAGGDNTAFAVAASILDKGISPGLCLDLLLEIWNPHCAPPWDDWELETKVRNAAVHGEDTDSGVKGHQSNASAFAAFEGQAYEAPAALEKRSRFKPLRLAEARKDVKPAAWLIPSFVSASGAGILFGKSGSYKTFLALDWALCLAYGIAGQWGAPPVKHTVLFLAGESSYALRSERVNSWCEKYGQNPDDETSGFIMVAGVPAFSDSEGWAEIRDGLLELNVQPDFIVVDTVTRMMSGLDENSNNDAKLVLNHLEEMSAHYGAFVLGIGHTGKDEAKGLRGAQALIDNSEVVHSMKKTHSGTSMRVVKLKEVDIPADQFYFEVEKIGASIVLNRTDAQPAEVEQGAGKSRYQWASVEEVVAILGTNGGRISTDTLVQDIAGKYGIEKTLIKKQLTENGALNWLRKDRNIWEIPKTEYDL